MPITAVVKVNDAGSLQQIQINAAEVVATLAAAHSAWGWIGGLRGIASVLRLCQRRDDSDRMNKLFQQVELDSASCHILCQYGVATLALNDREEPFGDTAGSKLIGLTLCALAYNLETRSAVHIIEELFLDQLFKVSFAANPGSKETISNFLSDNYPQIIHEGIVHHLNDRFDRAVSALNIKSCSKASSHPRLSDPEKFRILYPWMAGGILIKGFIKWLLDPNFRKCYYTRSAIVTRLAACMKQVGYQISEVKVWDGLGTPPGTDRALILVTGGAFETDVLMEETNYGLGRSLVYHYHCHTVGAMLWNSFAQEYTGSFFEVFQQDFDDIQEQVKESLSGFRWSIVDFSINEIQATPLWKGQAPLPASRIATRLASILFPDNIERIAPLYERIASEEYLSAAKTFSKVLHTRNGHLAGAGNRTSQRFQATSASICISILGRIAGKEFEHMRHATMIDFTHPGELNQLCTQVNAILVGACPMSKIIGVLAAIHCGVDPEACYVVDEDRNKKVGANSSRIVGWRNGRYAIVPTLLFNLESTLNKSMLGISCTDYFVANLPQQRDGSLRSPVGIQGIIEYDCSIIEEAISLDHDLESASHHLSGNDSIIIGPPMARPPDRPLYISVERPSYGFGEVFISLCGRVDGESLGNVAIHEVLRTLTTSWSNATGDDYAICTGGKAHVDNMNLSDDRIPADRVYNVPASRFCTRINLVAHADLKKEPNYNVYAQVEGSTPWAIFLAGQSAELNRITLGCAKCAIHTGCNEHSRMTLGYTTLIGYNG